ncbi:hypothetical protein J6590_085142 [Homalodisca vitripennis]|nr:hypothetical protein J6590_085142 [Homalodisca vitripennis]
MRAEVDFFLIEFLSGNGDLGSYLHGIGETGDARLCFWTSASNRRKRADDAATGRSLQLCSEDRNAGIFQSYFNKYVEKILRAKKATLDREKLIQEKRNQMRASIMLKQKVKSEALGTPFPGWSEKKRGYF